MPGFLSVTEPTYPISSEAKSHTECTAKSDPARTLKVAAIVGSGDYHSIGLREEVALEPKWKDFGYTFTVDKADEKGKSQCPAIGLGDKAGTVWFSGMSLVEVKADVKSASAGKEGSQGGPP